MSSLFVLWAQNPGGTRAVTESFGPVFFFFLNVDKLIPVCLDMEAWSNGELPALWGSDAAWPGSLISQFLRVQRSILEISFYAAPHWPGLCFLSAFEVLGSLLYLWQKLEEGVKASAEICPCSQDSSCLKNFLI